MNNGESCLGQVGCLAIMIPFFYMIGWGRYVVAVGVFLAIIFIFMILNGLIDAYHDKNRRKRDQLYKDELREKVSRPSNSEGSINNLDDIERIKKSWIQEAKDISMIKSSSPDELINSSRTMEKFRDVLDIMVEEGKIKESETFMLIAKMKDEIGYLNSYYERYRDINGYEDRTFEEWENEAITNRM